MTNCKVCLVGANKVIEKVKREIESIEDKSSSLKYFKEVTAPMSNGVNGSLLLWKDAKWGTYDDCDRVLRVLLEYDDCILSEDNCYKLMIVYDDIFSLNDEVYSNDLDDTYLENYHIIHDVYLNGISMN